MAEIAVLGYGIVGSGVVEVLEKNQLSINKKALQNVNIKYILDIRDFEGNPIQNKIIHDYNIILNDDDIKVVVEVMGGLEPAYTYVKQALLKGKSAVTSNKELVARYGSELLAIAKEKKVNFLFEASVGGGIPIIRPLNNSLTADEIFEITGILNGTTNYILTNMYKQGSEFANCLKEAQQKGYAERNPSADVDGFDTCRKIAILSSLAFGMQVDYENIYTEGITKITKTDIEYAKKLNCVIKLIAVSKKIGKEVFARVAPAIVDMEHPLSLVNDVKNAIFIKGNVIGDIMFYGSGAGKLPTASAVVADVIDAIRHTNTNILSFWSMEKMSIMDIENAPAKCLIRVCYNDYDKAVDECKKHFNIEKIICLENIKDEFGIVTHTVTEGEIKDSAAKIQESGYIQIKNIIRLEKTEDSI